MGTEATLVGTRGHVRRICVIRRSKCKPDPPRLEFRSLRKSFSYVGHLRAVRSRQSISDIYHITYG